jgi:hypothetical protein
MNFRQNEVGQRNCTDFTDSEMRVVARGALLIIDQSGLRSCGIVCSSQKQLRHCKLDVRSVSLSISEESASEVQHIWRIEDQP